MSTAYKVLTSEQMESLLRDGEFSGAPIDLADGYIHLSAAEQVTETVDKHFAGQTGLFVAAVDLTALGDAVKWEPSRGGQLFPHVYAVLPLSACTAHGPLARDAYGAVLLP
ncbi:DUF952 domain-containing protein [Novosphingobium sp.]|uniref:DUF952 domain-containing protein n=1 Tax=Novosphingobium sp. TaxID=1874826 RepID=UPI00260A7DAE|nr:DUF952 domain-containing protein [Novosphingobium sp.]